jgi:hypothetical protein
VLEAAWETEGVDSSEYHLLEVLRNKLGITRRDHRVVELQLGHLPGTAGSTHSVDEIEQAIQHLVKHGLVLRVQLPDVVKSYCIPSEMGDAFRELMGIELIAPAYVNLLNKLPVSCLRDALDASGQPFSGTREFLADRLMDSYVSPRAVLRSLDEVRLNLLLASLPSVRQEGSREIKVRNIVKYYDRLEFATPDASSGARPGEIYLQYYVDLAWRRHGVLRAAGVITKDLQVERRFEEATTALFTDYLGHVVERMEGTNHADGHVNLSDDRRVLLWDCKSCEGPYNLTDRLARQFLSYASAAAPRVASPMLVIGPDFTPESAASAMRLKAQCAPGTEVALISAEDLLRLGQTWKKRVAKAGSATPLPWQVLSFTGHLTEDVIKARLRTFSG